MDQMSNTSPERCDQSTPDKPYPDLISHPVHDYQSSMATTYQSYMAQEPPPFLLPGSSDHDLSMRAMPSYSLPVHGKAPSSYNDASSARLSYSRSSVGSAGRTNEADSYSSSVDSATLPSPVFSDKSAGTYFSSVPMAVTQPQQQQQRIKPGVPIGFDKLLHHFPGQTPPPAPGPTSRYRLHIRQHPIAARACGAGDRDRRPVDPPPIIQMLLADFDSGSAEDKEILKDPRFAVGCWLYPVTPGDTTTSKPPMTYPQEDPPEGPLLSGKSFVSPFNVPSDPDPSTSPVPPVAQPPNRADPQPATFFIFSDLSIRSAGVYRLQFRLINWGSVEDSGVAKPILAEAWSDPFRVYPAKDFPGMRDSSALAEGLKEAGFVELKTRGKGKGKGRRRGR